MKIKDFRLILLIVLIFVSLIVVIYPKFSQGTGVIVTSVEKDTPCKDVITVGSIITKITDKSINNRNDFIQFSKSLKGPITLIINDNPRSCIIPENSTLNVDVKNIGGDEGIKFSVDIVGGTLFLFKPEENVSKSTFKKTVETLESRMKVYDLSNTRGRVVEDSFIEIIMGLEEEKYINFLTEMGVLEGVLTEKVEFKDNKGNFKFNDKTYEVTFKDEKTILVNNSEYNLYQRFVLDDIEFQVRNISGNTTIFFLNLFNEEDLTLQEESRTIGSKRVIKQDTGYVYVIPVLVSKRAGENFAKATKGQEMIIDPSSGESFLQNPLTIFIDGNSIVDLPISGSDAGKEIKNLIIWGFKTNIKEATSDMTRITSILKTKRLPTNLFLVKTENFQPTLDYSLISLPLYTILITTIVVSVLFFIRYRKRGIMVLPLLLLSFSCIMLVFGALSVQWLALLILLFGLSFVLINGETREWVSWLSLFLMFIIVAGITVSKWIFDTSSIFGLIVIFIFSVCQGIIFGDRFLTLKKPITQSEYKNSLHHMWILTTVFTLILTVLFFLGGSFRSFSMVMVIGVLTSTTITTSIYYNLIERFNK